MVDLMKHSNITRLSITRGLSFGWKNRKAWMFTASSRGKERFARTKLGSLWLGLSNLLMIGSLSAVYGTVFRVPSFRSYVVYLGIGLVSWTAIASAVSAAPNVLRGNASKIKSMNLHPIFFILEEWWFQCKTFCQSFGLVVVVLSFADPSIVLRTLMFAAYR